MTVLYLLLGNSVQYVQETDKSQPSETHASEEEWCMITHAHTCTDTQIYIPTCSYVLHTDFIIATVWHGFRL